MKIAVVGSGVSGLAATWLLNEYSGHQVHLYEAESRPGGHANTVRYIPPGGDAKDGVDVDTGFIVLNPTTYPNFLRFLKIRLIPILPTEMTFSVSRDNGAMEWAGSNLFTVFCQPSRLLDPGHWRLIWDVMRFNACARRLIGKTQDGGKEMSIGKYLDREGYSDEFRDNYLIPMTAAIWSTPPDKCFADFPAHTLIQFLNNHHLLQITGKPKWLTIKGGSRLYVESILNSLPKPQLHLSTPVQSVSSSSSTHGPVLLRTTTGETATYDHIILATHSDAALSILNAGEGGCTKDEQRVLGGFGWNNNEAVLHCDTRLMPRSTIAWSCWNYLTRSSWDEEGTRTANDAQVALTYGMNDLQHISYAKHGPVLVTLNPPFDPEPIKTFGKWKYDHPILNSAAVKSQKEMADIQGKRGISFAGAWLRYGFHEDGFTSGLRAVVDHIPDVNLPFPIEYVERKSGEVFCARVFFDGMEKLGVRALIGWWFALWLTGLRRIFGLVFDLRHIGQEGRQESRKKTD